jgi:hypothetical protein
MARDVAGGRFRELGRCSSLDPWTVSNRGYPLYLLYRPERPTTVSRFTMASARLLDGAGLLCTSEINKGFGVEHLCSSIRRAHLVNRFHASAFGHGQSSRATQSSLAGCNARQLRVLTEGSSLRRWRLEGSVFSGREPDERWNFDPIRIRFLLRRLTVESAAKAGVLLLRLSEGVPSL